MKVFDRQLEWVDQGVSFSIRCCPLLADQGKSPATFLIPNLASRWQSAGSVRVRAWGVSLAVTSQAFHRELSWLAAGGDPHPGLWLDLHAAVPKPLPSPSVIFIVKNLLKFCLSVWGIESRGVKNELSVEVKNNKRFVARPERDKTVRAISKFYS